MIYVDYNTEPELGPNMHKPARRYTTTSDEFPVCEQCGGNGEVPGNPKGLDQDMEMCPNCKGDGQIDPRDPEDVEEFI